MRLEQGDEFPDFELPGADGQAIRKKDLIGLRYVLYFYPKDNTPGCTKEALEFTEVYPNLAFRNVYVFGVSADSAESHRRFKEKEGLKVILLTDEDHKLAAQVGAYGEKMNYGKKVIGTIRSTFLIGKDGRVEKSWYNVRAGGHAKKVYQAAIENFRDEAVKPDYRISFIRGSRTCQYTQVPLPSFSSGTGDEPTSTVAI